jgi:hypothetical protein
VLCGAINARGFLEALRQKASDEMADHECLKREPDDGKGVLMIEKKACC